MFSLNRRTSAIISIALIVIIWGSASSVTKLAVEDIPPYAFALLRNLVASVCLLPFYLYQRKKNPGMAVPPFRKIVWLGLTGISFFYLFFNLALYYTTAAAGALIQGFIPVAIILLAIIFLKERLTNLQITGILISVCGVVLIGFINTSGEARNILLGNILMIIAVLCWGIYTILSKSLQKYDAIYLTTMSTWVGTAFLIPAVIIEYWINPVVPVITLKGWAAIIHLGLFSSAICYILYNRVLKILSGVQVGNFMNLDPVVGAVIAVIFLHENITWWQVAGAVLVLAGVALTSKKSPKSF